MICELHVISKLGDEKFGKNSGKSTDSSLLLPNVRGNPASFMGLIDDGYGSSSDEESTSQGATLLEKRVELPPLPTDDQTCAVS